MSGETWGGYRVVINRAVSPHVYMVDNANHTIAFHDRVSLMQTLFWINMVPKLNAITRACWEEWRVARATPPAGDGQGEG